MTVRLPPAALAAAVFGVLLIAGAWLYTIDRVRTESAEATSSEFSKNANLALALDLHTNQLLKGIDQFLLVIKRQYEQPGPRVPIEQLIAPAMSVEPWITFIGVTDKRGDLVEAIQEFAPTNFSDRESFKTHQGRDSRALLIASPVLGLVSGRWAISLTRRRNTPDGSFGGVVHIAIEPRYLTELFENTTLGPSDIMSIVLTNGNTLARRRGPTIEFGANLLQSQLFAEHAKQPIGNFIGPGGVDGQLRVFSYRTMKDYPVLVTVGTSEADAFAPVRRRARGYYLTATFASAFIALVFTVGIVMLARQRRSNRQLVEQASLLDKAQDAIMVCGLDRRLSYWNKSAERLYGWTADEAVGRLVTDLLYQVAETEAVEKAYDQVMRTGEWAGDLEPQAKDGRRVIAESRWTLVRDAAGRPLRILTIDTDVTGRRQLEQQFYRAQRLESIGTLAGGIAHDLNNVLTPIILAVEMLEDSTTDPVDREILATVGKSAKRGAEMVRQVLSFARGQAGSRVEMRADELIADVERIARDTLPKNIEIRTHVTPGLPAVIGDPTQLHQVLLNLCVNARDAMPNGGRLAVHADAANVGPDGNSLAPGIVPGPYVVLDVEDTGTGIPPEILDKIFDPFFSTKGPTPGTGIGLSTSLTIVKNHGGHLRVYSEVGHGTRFRIYLPASTVDGSAASVPAATLSPRGDGQTVLIIDDEAAIRLLVQHLLESAGYQVLSAADGTAGVDVFTAHRASIAVVLVDMMMPSLGGADTIRALAAIDPRVPIIAASGISANEEAARAASPQVTHFLSKPFKAEALLSALGDVLAPA